jgi:hypothetical protein
MARFLPTLLAALLALALLVRAMWDARVLMSGPDISFGGPGEYHLVTPVASVFTVWHESTTTIDGVYSVREARLPPGTEIVIEHAGKIIPARVCGSNRTGGSAGDKSSVLSFTAPEPGDYLVKASGFQEKRSFGITRGNGIGPVFAVIGWFIGAGFSILVFLAFLILRLAKIFPQQPKPPRG